jgi:hypothetical protein
MAVRTELTRRAILAVPLAAAAQSPAPVAVTAEPPEKPVEFICPMDPDVRSPKPSRCPRCGMKLIAGLPDFVEFRVRLAAARTPRAGSPADLRFTVVDPRNRKPVRDFEIIHEKLFHLFIVSEDLEVFAHEHPVKGFGPEFDFTWTFPKPGLYRLMCDYYPLGATPQITVKTISVAPGQAQPPPPLESNTRVTLETEPAEPIAGMRTRLYFTLDPATGIQPWLGAWGHLLVASADTVDLIHTHPFIADGGAKMQFNVIFPRPGRHRVWVQFERAGMVNSARFDVTAAAL